VSETRLLVPLDGSALSEAILGVLHAGLAGASLALVGVAPEPESRGAVKHAIERAATRLRAEGFTDVVALVRDGRPADVIVALAAELRIDAIALATHGRSGFDRLVLGSVAERVIRAAPVPVLALRAGREMPTVARPLFEQVLLASDGSTSAEKALAALARLDGARTSALTVFSVDDTLEALGPGTPGSYALRRDFVAEIAEARRADLLESARRLAAKARDLGFAAQADVVAGSPASKILDRAEGTGASLVALTTHGRSGLQRWALGSVTERVLRAASAPLLIAR
jgi:nucleotide-binding universal stress UspA family protein